MVALRAALVDGFVHESRVGQWCWPTVAAQKEGCRPGVPEVSCVAFTAPVSGLLAPSLPQGLAPPELPTSVAERLPGTGRARLWR